jgi:hypothetical protein
MGGAINIGLGSGSLGGQSGTANVLSGQTGSNNAGFDWGKLFSDNGTSMGLGAGYGLLSMLGGSQQRAGANAGMEALGQNYGLGQQSLGQSLAAQLGLNQGWLGMGGQTMEAQGQNLLNRLSSGQPSAASIYGMNQLRNQAITGGGNNYSTQKAMATGAANFAAQDQANLQNQLMGFNQMALQPLSQMTQAYGSYGSQMNQSYDQLGQMLSGLLNQKSQGDTTLQGLIAGAGAGLGNSQKVGILGSLGSLFGLA